MKVHSRISEYGIIMDILFPNPNIYRIYKYIKLNDGQNILAKDIEAELQLSAPTVRKHLRWLLRRELIKRNGKRIYLADTAE